VEEEIKEHIVNKCNEFIKKYEQDKKIIKTDRINSTLETNKKILNAINYDPEDYMENCDKDDKDSDKEDEEAEDDEKNKKLLFNKVRAESIHKKAYPLMKETLYNCAKNK